MLNRGSSPVDWCESNYSHSPFIAEFVNTVSNAIFLFLPPILIWLFAPYGRRYNRGIHVVWLMLIIVGLCSAYYHCTLSLLGQLLDELAILWVLAVAFALWYPNHLLPQFLQHQKRTLFQGLICGLALLTSGLALVQPAFNAFALMGLGIPAVTLMVSELSRCRDSRVVRLGTRCGAIWLLAVACWINDKIFCETLLTMNFPYLHAFWHILIFIASYTACVLFAYFDANNMVPEQKPELLFWPIDKYELFGVPYVGLGSALSLSIDVDSTYLMSPNKQHFI